MSAQGTPGNDLDGGQYGLGPFRSTVCDVIGEFKCVKECIFTTRAGKEGYGSWRLAPAFPREKSVSCNLSPQNLVKFDYLCAFMRSGPLETHESPVKPRRGLVLSSRPTGALLQQQEPTTPSPRIACTCEATPRPAAGLHAHIPGTQREPTRK